MIRLYLVCGARLYRDGLSDALTQWFEVVGSAAEAFDALAEIQSTEADRVLLDGDTPNSVEAVRAVAAAAPSAKVIALAMPEVESRLIALAEAGISGYVSREGSIEDLVETVNSVSRGEMLCSPLMAATLLHRVTALAAEHSPPRPRARLTARQLEIVTLIEEGLTNKEIARRLCIELPTVKNQLHAIFPRRSAGRSSSLGDQAYESGPGAFPRELVLPRVEQRLDVTSLRLREVELREAAARFFRIVVRHRRFEPLPERRRLRELAAQPAQESDCIRSRRHSFFM